jgi:DNA-binding CsgD family transcriptional regulator
MLIGIGPKTDVDKKDLCLAPWLSPLIAAAADGRSIIEPLQSIVRSMGFESLLYAVGVGENLYHDEQFYLWTTAPEDWVVEYDRNNYAEIDPRVTYGWSMWPPPLIWDQTIAGGDARVEAFLERAAAFGIGSGLAVYLRVDSNKMLFALNCQARQLDPPARARLSASIPQAMYLGSVLNSVFMERVVRQGGPPMQQGRPLSAREIQCLAMAARGMTSHDIGLKLGITERTANFHFGNIVSKLGVLNRKEAIAMGIAYGIIRIDSRAAPLIPQQPSKAREAQFRRWENIRNARR